MEYQKKLAKPPRSLRDYTPEFHEAPEDWPEFLRLAIACRCYQEDEDRKRTPEAGQGSPAARAGRTNSRGVRRCG